MIECGEKLRLLRQAKGLTQLQVAHRIGVSKAMISAYETDSKLPSVEMLVRLSRLYGVTIDFIIRSNAPKYLDVTNLDEETVAHLAALVEHLKTNESKEA